jgi:hypothetical protein
VALILAQMYKLASATRGDKIGPSYGGYDHTGPWFLPSDTCCPLFNWDMNVRHSAWKPHQSSGARFVMMSSYAFDTLSALFATVPPQFPVEYQVVFSSNHPELGYSLTRLLSDKIVRQ